MTTLTTPAPEISRDRWQRPLVVPPNGGKAIPYTRCTTYVSCLEDQFGLQKWMMRQVALGLSQRPDLQVAVAAHRDDKRKLDELCDAAKEAAASSAGATTGTALHSLTEQLDRGQKVPAVLPAGTRASLDAYAEATADLKAIHIEQFCVQDRWQIGGTPDRVVQWNGRRYIADLKTGSIEYGVLKIAMQLAVYARSSTYDIATAERGSHGADYDRALIIHLPATEDPADAKCELIWVDIKAGWEAVKVARMVREKRKLKFHDLTEPFNAPLVVPQPSLEEQIAAAASYAELQALWQANLTVWTDAHTEASKARREALESGNPAA